MPEPIIGITTSVDEAGGAISRQVLGHAYVAAVERAGGCPLILPMVDRPETLRPALALLDGLVVTGGPGIVDGLVGALPSDLPPVPRMRAQSDLWAFEGAQARGLQVLGICYGMQFLNARFGGTIYADAQAQLGVGPHSPKRAGGRPVRHGVSLEAGTWLRRLAGEAGEAEVNSFHVQAVARVGAGLRVSARSPDGLVEGIETADGRVLGVQFHPEQLPGTVWDRLFDYLVARAAGKTGLNAQEAAG